MALHHSRRSRGCRLLAWWLWLWGVGGVVAAETNVGLTNIGVILRLPVAALAEEPAFRVEAVVTFLDPVTQECFVQSGDDAISLLYPATGPAVSRGQRIQIRGRAGRGGFAPWLLPDEIRVLGPGVLPASPLLTYADVVSGRHDCRFMSVEGVVRSADRVGGQVVIRLMTGLGRVRALLPAAAFTEPPSEWVGAVARVRGAVATDLTPLNQMSGIRLYAQTREDVTLLSEISEAFSAPLKSSADVLKYDPGLRLEARARVAGVATQRRRDGGIFLEDAAGAVLVLGGGAEDFALPQRLEAVGFPVFHQGMATLEDSVFRVAGPVAAPPATVADAEALRSPRLTGRRVRLRGELRELPRAAGETALVMRLDGSDALFEARMESGLPEILRGGFAAGAVFEVTGVRLPFNGAEAGASRPVVLVGSPENLIRVRAAPFWTVRRAMLLLALVATAALMAIVIASHRRARLSREYQVLFDTTWDGVLRLDARGGIRLANRAAARMLGEESEKLPGTSLADHLLARSRPNCRNAMATAASGSAVVRVEVEVPQTDGSVRLADLALRRIPDSEDVEAVLRDMTDRRRQELNTTLNRLSSLIGAKDSSVATFAKALVGEVTPALRVSQTSVWRMDAAGTGLRLLCGHPEESFRKLEDTLLRPEALPVYFAAMREEQVMAVDDTLTDRRTAELKDSYFAPLDVRSLLDGAIIDGGRLVGVICLETVGERRTWTAEERVFARAVANQMLAAITHQQRERAQSERARLARIVETTTDLVVITDTAGLVVFLNPEARRRLVPDGKDGPLFLSDLFPDEFRRGTLQAWIGSAVTEAIWAGETFLRTGDGDLPVSLVAIAQTDASGEVELLSFMMRDIRRRLETEAALRSAKDHLEIRVAERTQELAAANERLKELDRLKSEFLATMSHELRTPLNSIIGFSGILKSGMAGPVSPEQKKQLEMVYGSSKHLLGLINDLLDLSRVESGRMDLDLAKVSPSEVAAEVGRTLAPMVAQKGLRYETCVGDPETPMICDRKKLFQILLNLANNAVKFTDKGGVTVRGWRDGETYRFSVTDTGMGIRPENMGQLFEAFRQVDGSARRVYEGTGLGLYLCRKLLGLLCGDIGARSEFGQGSCFTFHVPLVPAKPGGAP